MEVPLLILWWVFTGVGMGSLFLTTVYSVLVDKLIMWAR